MRRSALVWAVVASMATCVVGGYVTPRATSMPTCAEECLIEYLPSSACKVATNVTCICTDADLTAQMETCVAAGCSTRDALLTERFDAQTCDWPVTDDSLGLKVIVPLFGILAVVFFLLRVWARWLTGIETTWGADDWVMMGTTIASIPLTVVSYLFSAHGLGKDLYMVEFADITFVLEMYYYSEILYLVVIFTTKISICCFYLRIFPKKNFRMRVYTLIGLTIAAACAFIPITIFQCTPVPGAWLKWDGTYETTCRDVQVQALWGALVSIALDVATIILPMTELWTLKLSTRRKAGVMLMFATGMFVVIVQILRIIFLLRFRATSNFTRDYVATSVWSNVEVYVGIMCECFPHIRTLLTRFAPRAFATTQGASGAMGYGGSSGAQFPGGSGGSKMGSKVGKSQFSQRPVHGDETDFVELRTAAGQPDGFSSRVDLKGDGGDSGSETRTVKGEDSEVYKYPPPARGHGIV